MPKVSVVIPVYGVEKYIARCAVSLMEQTLDDMEFIFVNDCTQDNSIEELKRILALYPNRSAQVKIINKDYNEGLSFARKTGVENASGDYIGFCDSDDWVDITMYEKLYNKAFYERLDYVKCGHYITNGITTLSRNNVNLSDSPNKEEMLSRLLRCTGLNSVWDTLTRRKVFEDHSFKYTSDSMLEDFFLATQIIESCSSYGVVDEPLYFYFQNPDSISNSPSEIAYIKRGTQARDNALWIIDYIHQLYGNKYTKEEVVLKNVPRRIIIPIMINSSNYSIWNSFFPGNSVGYLLSPYVALVLKLQYLLVLTHLYPIYKKLSNHLRLSQQNTN